MTRKMWALYVLVMTGALGVTSNTISFESRDLCQQAQQAITQQMMRLNPQPQFQTICMPTKKIGEEIK